MQSVLNDQIDKLDKVIYNVGSVSVSGNISYAVTHSDQTQRVLSNIVIG